MSGLGRFLERVWWNARYGAKRLVAPLVLPREPFWLRVRIAAPVLETSAPPWVRRRGVPWVALLLALREAARDARVRGVVVKLQPGALGATRAVALHRELRALRDAGKRVLVYGERLGLPELVAASGGEQVVVPEAGAVHLTGLRFAGFYGRRLLERIGVVPEVISVGRYKSAAESFVRDSMSPEQREQLEALADDGYAEFTDAIAQGRGLAPARVRELVDAGPYGAPAAQEAGLIDRCAFPDEVPDLLREWEGRTDDREPAVVPAGTYAALRPGRGVSMGGELPRIAVVSCQGVLRGGEGPGGIGSDTYRRLLGALREDRRVSGVLLRIDSPGGDTLASDLVWRATRKLREEKPVVVSMGDVAASGGYYLAAAADWIFAEASTVTGSIGVVAGRIQVAGLLERLGLASDGVERGARAGMDDPTRALTPDERAHLRGEMDQVYARFLDRIAEGREIDRGALERVAQGRVWSGRAAREVGLVDAIGGPLEALAELRRRAGITEGRVVALDLHPRGVGLPGWLPRFLRIGSWHAG